MKLQSAKYLGLNKGVVAYALLTNHVPLNVRIIGANELHQQLSAEEISRLCATG